MTRDEMKVGMRFGHWTMIAPPHQEGRKLKVRCQCDCGRVKDVNASNVTRGVTRSCGCGGRTALQRFWQRVDLDPSGCWIWQGAVNFDGYGQFAVTHAHGIMAHRFAYLQFIGPIPDGMPLDHLCRVRLCVNPNHLEAVTPRENNLRSPHPNQYALRTHCKHGHEYTPENTARSVNGARRCRTCMLERGRRDKARLREKRHLEAERMAAEFRSGNEAKYSQRVEQLAREIEAEMHHYPGEPVEVAA